jgi:20S proteasome alpha/beta subunit
MIPLAVKAINMAKKRDVYSGGEVDIVTVTESGFKRLSADEITKYVKKIKKE